MGGRSWFLFRGTGAGSAARATAPFVERRCGTVTISFGGAVRRKTSVIMLFVKLPAGQTADLTGRPLQQQNERRPTKRKGQSEVEIVSVCRKDAPHAHLANEIPVMQCKPAARWVLLNTFRRYFRTTLKRDSCSLASAKSGSISTAFL
jgi:hypothetical protein